MECPDCDGVGLIRSSLALCALCKGKGVLPDDQPVTKVVTIRGGRRVEVTTYPEGMERR